MPRDIDSIGFECGVVSTLACHIGFYFEGGDLEPYHFESEHNRFLYQTLQSLALNSVETVDAYIIHQEMERLFQEGERIRVFKIEEIQDFLDNSIEIARSNIEEYKLLVKNVINCSFRREMLRKLQICEKLCIDSKSEELEKQIYDQIDGTVSKYLCREELPVFGDLIDELWEAQKEKKENGGNGIPFKFPLLNEYTRIIPGELFIVGAVAKGGKSFFCQNVLIDLLEHNKSVLYIDSELTDPLFYSRILTNLTGIPFKRVNHERLTEEEMAEIEKANNWLKDENRRFSHCYMPICDPARVYAMAKKAAHKFGKLDVIIVDYFKSSGSSDAFATYAELGNFVDVVKNKICGDMNIAGIGAAQASDGDKLADSKKIGRNASTIAMLTTKTPEEQQEYPNCGNKKLRIVLNRNGAQMTEDEWIDLSFNGDLAKFEQAPEQHATPMPY